MAFLPAHIILFGISGGEILIVLLAVLLLFGPKKIPEIARMIGRGINEVKKVQREINSEIHRYSADIENEARGMQQSIDQMKKDMTAAGEDPGVEAGKPPSTVLENETFGHTGAEEENKPATDGEDDDLPYPYNQRTGEGH